MKKWKKVIRNVTIVFGCIIIVLVSVGLIGNKLAEHYDEKDIRNAYGQKIDVDGRKMCVNVEGQGDQVIVLLPGWGNYSPVIDFKPLVDQLKDNYVVVTIEYFGYGLSDRTDKPRTIENITNEVHTVIQKLGYQKYILMAHSISGVYGIYYASKWPNEVEKFVGIEASFPEQKQEKVEGFNLGKCLSKLGVYRIASKNDVEALLQNGAVDYYSKKEIELNRKIALHVMFNKNSCGEYKLQKENFEKAKGLYFDSNIPVLYILANENIEEDPTWESGRLPYMQNSESKIIKLDGGHYFYGPKAKEIADSFKEWDEQKN